MGKCKHNMYIIDNHLSVLCQGVLGTTRPRQIIQQESRSNHGYRVKKKEV
jgi:hypothetical protein